MKKYGESIYATRGGPFPNGEWGGFTHKDNVIYVHVLDRSKMPDLLPAIDRKIRKATCLTGGKVRYEQEKNGLKISVSGKEDKPIDTIIKLELQDQ
jgi:alpha-L-fucosidase